MAGFVLLGLGLRKADAAPSWVSLVMISAAVGAVPVMFFVLFYVPSGPLLTFHITWFALGYVLWSGRTCPSEAP
jgi:hypothetical protein